MAGLRVVAPAKLNLTLDILSRRADGYHNLESIMHSIDLCDIIMVEEREKGIEVSCSDKSLPGGRENLAYRAAEFLLREAGMKRGVSIHIKKNIPIGAGLGGGSADAAATLRAINELFRLRLTTAELREIGSKIGSDVPFCVGGGTALVRGRGEEVEPIATPLDAWFILVKPRFSVSTREAYDAFDRMVNEVMERPKIDGMLGALADGDYKKVGQYLCNVMEVPIFEEFPILREIKEEVIRRGAVGALMSGSGSTIFGIVVDEREARRVGEEVKMFLPSSLVGGIFISRSFKKDYLSCSCSGS